VCDSDSGLRFQNAQPSRLCSDAQGKTHFSYRRLMAPASALHSSIFYPAHFSGMSNPEPTAAPSQARPTHPRSNERKRSCTVLEHRGTHAQNICPAAKKVGGSSTSRELGRARSEADSRGNPFAPIEIRTTEQIEITPFSEQRAIKSQVFCAYRLNTIAESGVQVGFVLQPPLQDA